MKSEGYGHGKRGRGTHFCVPQTADSARRTTREAIIEVASTTNRRPSRPSESCRFMRFQFTPAAQRVLQSAADWTTDNGAESPAADVGHVDVLLGLLAEPEYRAAGLLAARGIDESAVVQRWPTAHRLSTVATPNGSADEHAVVADVADRQLAASFVDSLAQLAAQFDLDRSTALATEHLLLALVSTDDDVARWLTARKVTADLLTADICARYKLNYTPISVDDLTPEPPQPVTPAADTMPAVSHEPSEAAIESTAAAPITSTVDAEVAVLRILDAAANRAGEALRVVEDYVRFVLDDRRLTEECKRMRHDLTSTLAALPESQRLAARDTVGDVGTAVSTSAEYQRRDAADVAGANLRRLQESLRSLEEFSKLIDPTIAARCEQLRYRSYTLHRAVLGRDARRAQMAAARLYVLIDGGPDLAAFDTLAASLIGAGVDVIQLRDKRLDDRSLLARAHALRRLTRGTRTLFVMNDRADLASAADADGVHVGQEELGVAEARRIVGPGKLIGVSTHSIDQARRAVADGADYIGVGPTFPGPTKEFAEFPGLPLLRAVAAEISLPAFAIGGITAANLGEVLATGMSRVAVSSAVAGAADPAAAARELRGRLQDDAG